MSNNKKHMSGPSMTSTDNLPTLPQEDTSARETAARFTHGMSDKSAAERYSFVCNAGCGVCRVKVKPFEYERTETLEGEHVGSKYEPRIVSSCCGSEVHVYDNEADTWGAEVTLAAPSVPSAQAAEVAQPVAYLDDMEHLLDQCAQDWNDWQKQGNDEDRSAWIASRRAALDYFKQHALASSPSSAPAESGWQPIETAPKDGRTLLLGHYNRAGNWRTMRGQWMSENYIAECWEEPDNGEPGWFETSAEADDVPNCWATTPTHWMPLPAAPQAVQAGGEA